MHSREHITDVGVWRLRVARGATRITIAWDYPGATLLEVRILRSLKGFAERADTNGQTRADADGQTRADTDGQTRVYEGHSGVFREDWSADEGVAGPAREGPAAAGAAGGSQPRFYTVFARAAAGDWALWERVEA